MFGPEQVAFLESGCALIIGTVSEDGEPLASRGWGLNVVRGSDCTHVRLLLDADDRVAIERVRAGGRVAITACSVPTLRSLQLKGRAIDVVDATDTDRSRAAQYCEAFFEDIHETDGTPRSLTGRMEPSNYCLCTITVDEAYDQTPGPNAGVPLTAVTK